jgi:hypothetical protein
VPLKFALGEAFQFDWSEEGLVIGGVWRKLLVAHLKLCASRAFVLVAYPSQGHEMLFDAHTRSFAALGGIPRRGIYDNMKTAVDKVKKGKGRVVNARFAAMCSHYLFDADFCNVAGLGERRRREERAGQPAAHLAGSGPLALRQLRELNTWLLARCQALWQEIRHPEYALSVAEMLEHEQPQLMPMVTAFDGYVEEPGRVSSTCLVSVARNHYSVPCELAGRLISKRLYPERIEIVFDDAVVASHPRRFERGQTCYDWRHYLSVVERKPGALRNGAPFAGMPESLIRLQRLLLKRDGGDRVMSQMLAAVPRRAGGRSRGGRTGSRIRGGERRTCPQRDRPPQAGSASGGGADASGGEGGADRRHRPLRPLRSRRSTMREIAAELKALRLYGMAGAWSELTEGGQARVEVRCG